ncbi:hypothetical protein MBLNU230_g2349t1 [Neophaeotheca triangularis]
MADRRRLNAPQGGTNPPIFASTPATQKPFPTPRNNPTDHRKIFLRTKIVPSASGSAYYEIAPASSSATSPATLDPRTSTPKITATVHGPRPLPRNAAFSPNLLLTTTLKFAPFATKKRRGYVRDSGERDLGVHLQTALEGVVIGERWPKSSCEVVVTVLEGEEDGEGWGSMAVLAGAVTAASAALVEAGVDCLDLVSGGFAAVVEGEGKGRSVVMDPRLGEERVLAGCVVAYALGRDEVMAVWLKGEVGSAVEELTDVAVQAAVMTRGVLAEAVKEAAEGKRGVVDQKGKEKEGDVDMTG